MIAQAAAVLPEFMQVPAIMTTGTPFVSSGGSSTRRSRPARDGTPIRSPRYGNSSTAPSTRASNGAPKVALTDSQTPITPPMFKTCSTSPGATASGNRPE